MLKLYMKIGCPYCKKVLDQNHESIGADIELKYITHEENLQEVIRLGGKRQVPFLVDDERDVSMYESDDIVEYLAEHYSSAE